MWDIIWVSPQGHKSVSVSHHFLLQAPQCPHSLTQPHSRTVTRQRPLTNQPTSRYGLWHYVPLATCIVSEARKKPPITTIRDHPPCRWRSFLLRAPSSLLPSACSLSTTNRHRCTRHTNNGIPTYRWHSTQTTCIHRNGLQRTTMDQTLTVTPNS